MRYLIGSLGLAVFWFSLGKYGLQAAQRLDTTRRRMNSHEVNMASAEARLRAKFEAKGVTFPPAHTVLTFFKDRKELWLYAGDSAQTLKLIHRYPVLAASGKAGPKLREGDEQVPEGLYRIELLNPKSKFHLSLRVNYPNELDREQARRDRRSHLGGDIMIHGEAVSVGCIAIGNVAIEEIYRLGERTDFKRWEILLSPVDFRVNPLSRGKRNALPWMETVYQILEQKLKTLPTA